jgi:ubiquinone/menaquinone biosynthesis C-methylase UbiE
MVGPYSFLEMDNDSLKFFELGKPSLIFGPGQKKRLSLIKKYVDLKGKRILDVGCGIGVWSRAFSKEGAEVFGIDIDEGNIEEAKKLVKEINFCVGRAEKLPYEGNFFDVVFLHEVIEHVEDDEEVLREAIRVLKPGGKVIVFAPNRLFPFETHGIHFFKKRISGNIPFINWLPLKIRNIFCSHVRIYTEKSLIALLERIRDSANLQIEVSDYVWPAFDKIEREFPTFGKILKKLANFAEKNPLLKKFGISLFIVVRKGD